MLSMTASILLAGCASNCKVDIPDFEPLEIPVLTEQENDRFNQLPESIKQKLFIRESKMQERILWLTELLGVSTP